MNFISDTESPAHPAVIEAVARVNDGAAASYGADEATARATALFAEIFETEVSVVLVGSGTAANALALSVLCSPTGAVLAHREAHIEKDERGAVEFFTGGGKIRLLGGAHGKVDLNELDAALAANRPDFVHETPLEALSLTNLTEAGAAYTVEETAARCDRAEAAGLSVHLDGARLSAAVATLGVAPADLAWRAGVDVLSFGGTKGGAMGADAIVLFGDARARHAALAARAKRAGHMPAKQRFMAAQLEALLKDGLWLELAGHAHAQALSLAATIETIPDARIIHPVDGNEVFAALPAADVERLLTAGARFYPWDETTCRFVCSWATSDEEIGAFEKAARS
ncbi:MAG: beta-eliminating lyase-related protein [Maricaulaceae bacterium]|jgi:threonine aldolase